MRAEPDHYDLSTLRTCGDVPSGGGSLGQLIIWPPGRVRHRRAVRHFRYANNSIASHLTEPEPIANALEDAALVWPELRGDRGALLRKLVDAGRASVHTNGGAKALIRNAAGAVSGTYPGDARAELPSEWPVVRRMLCS